MKCVSTTAYSVSINGTLHGFFRVKRGLRQGDPLSPYLFTICLEMLSRSLKFSALAPDFNFHPKCKPLGITHLAYANDILLISRGDFGSVNILMKCLNDFRDMTGLHTNVLKSNLFCAGVSDIVRYDLRQLTGFQMGVFPFRYLGIPIASTKLKISDYCPLFDKLSSKINSWPKNTLSHAGRLELIRSVLQGTHCYWMSVLPFPEGVIKKIDAACRNFFWSSKHPAISWKTVCKPLECGGLGLRNLRSWNKALLCKLLWNIHAKKDSLWIKWLHHYYFHGSLNYSPKSDDSTLLKSLARIRNELCLHGESDAMVSERLVSWFSGTNTSLELPYQRFFPKYRHWPWKPLLCKPGLLPKHKISFWLFSRRKFLTRETSLHTIEEMCPM